MAIGGGKILGAKRPNFGAEGAVLENFSDILEKLFLKNVIKLKKILYWVYKNFRYFFEKLLLKTAIKSKY